MIRGLRFLAAATLAFVVGAYALSTTFSDPSPGESLLGRGLVTGGAILLGGVAIGALQAHRWWISIAVGWGPMLVGALMLAARWRGAVQSASPKFAVLCIVGAPVLGLLGGFIGARLIARWGRKPTPAP
jgi:hypothetical protein